MFLKGEFPLSTYYRQNLVNLIEIQFPNLILIIMQALSAPSVKYRIADFGTYLQHQLRRITDEAISLHPKDSYP